MDLAAFAADVGDIDSGPVAIVGASTRGGAPSAGVRTVRAPSGIDWMQADEMIVSCGAATMVTDLDAELATVGQCVALPPSGTVGGALAVGQSGVRRLGYGPIRDALLECHYVSATGEVVKAGGPTVKNVSGFDLCRLLVGSRGTLGFIGSVILRTRPIAQHSQWFVTDEDPFAIHAALYRPVAVLWNGSRTWVLLEGHPDDIVEESTRNGLTVTDGPPVLPTAARWSVPPASLRGMSVTPGFVAEIGVGVVHHSEPAPARTVDAATRQLHDRLKHEFDPTGRLNPDVHLLDV